MDKAGFQLLTVDVEDFVVDYPDMARLCMDLGWMGEGNAVLGREMGGIGRDVWMAAEAIYKELHGNEDGTVPATFRIIYMVSVFAFIWGCFLGVRELELTCTLSHRSDGRKAQANHNPSNAALVKSP